MAITSKVWVHDTRLKQMEQQFALEGFSMDPDKEAKGLEYQPIIDAGRGLARARVAACLAPGNPAEDQRCPSFYGENPLPENSLLTTRLQRLSNFREEVRGVLGNDYLVGNMHVDDMSLNAHLILQPAASFNVYRHPSIAGTRKYDFVVSINMLTGEMIMGLTLKDTGYHYYVPMIVNSDNLLKVMAKLTELADSSDRVGTIHNNLNQGDHLLPGDFFRMARVISEDLGIAPA